jgi:PAS domain S-box-containing protein
MPLARPVGVSLSGEEQSAEALTERLRRLEAAVEATALGVWEWDVQSGRLTWNDRNRELFGVAAGRELEIQDYAGLVHPDDREALRDAYLAVADDPEGGSFSMEYRTLVEPEGRARWVLTRGRVLRDAGGARRVVGSTLDITDRKAAEERRTLLLRELEHRSKNGILVMMAIVAQTARSAVTVEDFEAVLMARLRSMAESQDLVTRSAGKPLPLSDIIERALTPFDTSRFDVASELADISVPSEIVVGIALLLHELSTNAVKYGALSRPKGRVRLGLLAEERRKAVLGWTEVGGPPVGPVTRKGFGSRLLEVSLRDHGGQVEAEFDPSGFRARVHFPAAGA